MKNKRGISPVIATALIILLVIIGVGILWASVGKLIGKSGEGNSADCFTLDIEPIVCAYTLENCPLVAGYTETFSGNLIWVFARRNEGDGQIKTAKIVIKESSSNTEAPADIVDMNIPELDLKFKKDLSNVKEHETFDIVSNQLDQFLTQLNSVQPSSLDIRASIAPIVGENIICPYTREVKCEFYCG